MQWYLDAVNYAKTNLSINVDSFRHVIGDLPMMEGCGIMGRGMFGETVCSGCSFCAVFTVLVAYTTTVAFAVHPSRSALEFLVGHLLQRVLHTGCASRRHSWDMTVLPCVC